MQPDEEPESQSEVTAPQGAEADSCADGTCESSSGGCERLLAEGAQRDAIAIGLLLPQPPYPERSRRTLKQAAVLAAEQLNARGGIPLGAARDAAQLQLVLCEDGSRLSAAARLLNEQRVRALLSAEPSDAVLELALRLTIESGALVVSSVAQASSLADLVDDDLVFQLAPGDRQRAPLFSKLLEQLAQQLPAAELRVAIAGPAPSADAAVREALSHARLGERSLSDALLNGNGVRLDGYRTLSEARSLVDRYCELTPRLIVLLGGPESVSDLLAPLEAYWPRDAARPHYLLGDAAKHPELMKLVERAPELAARLHGVGAAAPERAAGVLERFEQSYGQRFPGERAPGPEAAHTYDAVYTLALALARSGTAAPSGHELSAALRQLAAADDAQAAHAHVDSDDFAVSLARVREGAALQATASLARLAFDADGGASGAVESWCVTHADGAARFTPSGLRVEESGAEVSGEYRRCPNADAAPQPPAAESSEPAMPTAPQPSQAPAPQAPAPEAPPPPPPPSQNAPPAPTPPERLRAEVAGLPLQVQIHTDSFWDAGHCDTLEVKNIGPRALTWTFRMRMDGSLTKLWSCEANQVGSWAAFRGVDFNSELSPGASAWLGYCVTYASAPQ